MAILSFGNCNLPKSREGKGKNIIAFPDTYCVLDTETTGLSPEWDEIIEVGAIRYYKGEEVDRFQSLIQPIMSSEGEYVSPFITELTGITNEMLSGAPRSSEVMPVFADFLGTDPVVGYNVAFDINFLYDAFDRINRIFSNDYIDVMRLARKLYPDLPHHRLKDMVKVLSIPVDDEHRALADVVATATCYTVLHNNAIRKYGSEDAFIDVFKGSYNGRRGVRAGDVIGDESKNNPDSPLYKKYCVFTGKLERFSRQEAMKIVADLGGINEDGVTKHTNYLILGNNDYCKTITEGKSNKQKKAESYKLKGQDIEILSETVFYDMLKDGLGDY